MGLLDRTNYHMITNKDKIKVYRMLEEIRDNEGSDFIIQSSNDHYSPEPNKAQIVVSVSSHSNIHSIYIFACYGYLVVLRVFMDYKGSPTPLSEPTNKATEIAFPSQFEVAIRAAEEILKIHSRKAELLEAKS